MEQTRTVFPIHPLHYSQIENPPSLLAESQVQASSLSRKGFGMARFALRAGTKRNLSRRNGSWEDPANHLSLSLSSRSEGHLGSSSDHCADEHHAELGVRIQAILPCFEGLDVLRNRQRAPSNRDPPLFCRKSAKAGRKAAGFRCVSPRISSLCATCRCFVARSGCTWCWTRRTTSRTSSPSAGKSSFISTQSGGFCSPERLCRTV